MTVYSYDNFIKRHLGVMGRYQVFLTILASLDLVTTGYYVMLPVFIASTPPHYCAPPSSFQNCCDIEWRNWGVPDTCTLSGECNKEQCLMYKINASEIQHNCSMGLPAGNVSVEQVETEPCTTWLYEESFYAHSAAQEFDLVCDRRGLANSIAAAYMLGRMVGSLLLGWIGDKMGRRRSMMLMTVLTFACALATGFAPNIYVLLALRFAIAAFDMTRSNIGFIMGMEYLHQSKRAFFAGVWGIVWSAGYLGLPLIAYYIQQWRTLLIVLSIPEVFIFIAYALCLPESPRWLMLQGRKDEAKVIIEKMAKYNGRTLPKEWDIEVKENKVHTAKLRDLVRSPALLLLSVIMAYIFFANSLVFYGLSLNTSNLAGNEYFNFFVIGAVEIPAYIPLSFCYEKLKRRPPFGLGLVLGGITVLMAILPLPTELSWLQVAFCMVGKFFMTFTFMSTWLIVGEVFPTAVRVSGLGITNAAARIGSVVASYITLLIPMYWCIVVFALSAMLAGLLVLFIPETRGMILPQTIREGETFVRTNICKIGLCNKDVETKADNKTQEEADDVSTTLMKNPHNPQHI